MRVEAGHERKHGDQAFAIDQLDKPRIVDHVALGLEAAVQDHDHRDRLTGLEIVRQSDRILASTGAGLVRAGRVRSMMVAAVATICLPDLGQHGSDARGQGYPSHV